MRQIGIEQDGPGQVGTGQIFVRKIFWHFSCPLSEWEFLEYYKVGFEPRWVVGFKSADGSGKVIRGGLIGAWNCLDTQVSFTLAVTGYDANIVQLRFNRLINDFGCAQG